MYCDNFSDKQVEAIRNYLEDCDTSELLSVIHTCRSINGFLEDMDWLEMCMFDELYQEKTPLQIAIDVSDAGNDFDPYDDYFRFDSCGNLESSDTIELDSYEINDVIDALDSLNYKDLPESIKDVLKEAEEDDDYDDDDDDAGYYGEDF